MTEGDNQQQPDRGVYRALMAHYIHYDSQMWRRTQILFAIQAAVLTGGFSVSQKNNWIGATIMFVGMIFTLIVAGLIYRDRQNRDVNIDVMDSIAEDLIPEKCSRKREELRSGRVITLRQNAPCCILRGQVLVWIAIVLLLVIDLDLGVLYVARPDLFRFDKNARQRGLVSSQSSLNNELTTSEPSFPSSKPASPTSRVCER